MTTIGEWLNPTRAVGLIAYSTAATCCAIAWARGQDWRLARLLTLIEITLLLDVAFNWRWTLHQLLMDIAQGAHEYQVRRMPQVIALLILAGLFSLGLLTVRRLSRGRDGNRLAVAGALVSLALWCTEVISLHQVDHVLYYRLGKIMVVSLLWILACMMTSIGMLSTSRHTQTDLV